MSIIATDWFLCLFATSLPPEVAARVWDVLLYEGSKVKTHMRRSRLGCSVAGACDCMQSVQWCCWFIFGHSSPPLSRPATLSVLQILFRTSLALLKMYEPLLVSKDNAGAPSKVRFCRSLSKFHTCHLVRRPVELLFIRHL